MDRGGKIVFAGGIAVACAIALGGYLATAASPVRSEAGAWFVRALIAGLVLAGIWLLALVVEPRRRWRERHPEPRNAEVHLVTASTDAVIFAPDVKTTVNRKWLAWASEPSGLWNELPGMKGVLLSLKEHDGEPMNARLLCEVTLNGQPQGSAEVEASGVEMVTRMFPGDFTSAPSLPLRDGDYEVTWSRETNDGVGWEKMRTIIVQRRGGRIGAVLDESGGPA